ncbi:hypothetical protein JG688_00012036 [Phytophthora aleatoria]|uniref:Uncharacterized protein n=1 Tax=Phytophthora aleatoria TaxID=2496075 RepID=A0A8J5IRP4_9STRA|nr:hypothetical protein JG688_00012036 [Phytophthora aleatoria]
MMAGSNRSPMRWATWGRTWSSGAARAGRRVSHLFGKRLTKYLFKLVATLKQRYWCRNGYKLADSFSKTW